MQRFIGTKLLNGKPMSLGAYNDLREYIGTVINAKKTWVEIPYFFRGKPLIADENNITSITVCH